MQIRQPRTNDSRELERWQDSVSRQITNAQSMSENEILSWFPREGKIMETKEKEEDLRIELAMLAINAQELRDILSKVIAIETKLEMLSANEEQARENARQLSDMSTLIWMGD